MKKAYTKPLIYVESFEMMEHISKGCGVFATFGGDACPITVDGLTFFTTEGPCSADAVSMFTFEHFNPDQDDPVRFLIDRINPTCYNSLTDFHQMFVS